MTLLRFRIGRWLIHAGLRMWPQGRARQELTGVLADWGLKVRQEIARHERRLGMPTK